MSKLYLKRYEPLINANDDISNELNVTIIWKHAYARNGRNVTWNATWNAIINDGNDE